MSLELSVIITSFKEPKTVGRAVEQILKPNADLWHEMEVIVVAPDDATLHSAQEVATKYIGFKNFMSIKDEGEGKPAALNQAVSESKGKILILTDGDVYLDDKAIPLLLKHFDKNEIYGVTGHPISIDNRDNQFGYYSHLFCSAADKKRLSSDYTPMSGYLYAIRNSDKLKGLFPLDKNVRAEDAYISMWMANQGLNISYEPKALVNVMFPKNKTDWIKQKARSLGGNVQLKEYIDTNSKDSSSRNIAEDLKMIFYPFTFAKTANEYWYSAMLYPLRLQLWFIIYKNHKKGNYSKGAWERIESSK